MRTFPGAVALRIAFAYLLLAHAAMAAEESKKKYRFLYHDNVDRHPDLSIEQITVVWGCSHGSVELATTVYPPRTNYTSAWVLDKMKETGIPYKYLFQFVEASASPSGRAMLKMAPQNLRILSYVYAVVEIEDLEFVPYKEDAPCRVAVIPQAPAKPIERRQDPGINFGFDLKRDTVAI